MSISDEIDNMTIAIDETVILAIKSLFNIKILFSKSSCGN